MPAPRRNRDEAFGGSLVSSGAVVFLCFSSVLLALLTLYSLWAFWPETAGGEPPTNQSVRWFTWKAEMSREFLFFLAVALAGALGGLIHTIRSFAWYIGNRRLRWSWVPFNLLLPLVGALGGTVFYLVLRAGLFSPSTSADQASPFGFAAVAVLTGLFSEQAFKKLRDVATNLFAERDEGADHVDAGE